MAAGTLGAAMWRQTQDTQAGRRRELDEKVRDRRNRQDATISGTVQNLGSENPRLRLNAAAALTPMLRLPLSEVSARGLLTVFVANLRTEDDPDVLDVLVDDLEATLTCLDSEGELPLQLDLTRKRIRRLRVSSMTFHAVDLAFSTCRDSDLTGCTLRRVRGFGADLSRTQLSRANLHEARLNKAICDGAKFHNTRLVSATLKASSLIGAQFQRAELQGAHFESAQCCGAVFTDANVAEAWFCDSHGDRATQFDESALLSLRQAHNWRAAHLSRKHREWLESGSPKSKEQSQPATGRPA